jgi:cytidine deaminase
METIPAVPIKDVNDSPLRISNSDSSFSNIIAVDGNHSNSDPGDLLVEEMRNFRDYFYQLRDSPESHDLSLFWMRKTKKPVLSVLCVRIHEPDGSESYELIRGTNMEVSMPTGSLCAERNAIGTALGKDIALKRQNIVGVAVLGVSLEANRCFSISPVSSPKRSNSLRNLLELNDDTTETETGEEYYQENESYMRNVTMLRLPSGLPSMDKDMHINGSNTSGNNRNSTPLKKSGDGDHRGPHQSQYLNRHNYAVKRTIATVSSKDRNPLRPCGACTEWLKKISSVNPSFFVLTFTNEELSGIFREEIDSFD